MCCLLAQVMLVCALIWNVFFTKSAGLPTNCKHKQFQFRPERNEKMCSIEEIAIYNLYIISSQNILHGFNSTPAKTELVNIISTHVPSLCLHLTTLSGAGGKESLPTTHTRSHYKCMPINLSKEYSKPH